MISLAFLLSAQSALELPRSPPVAEDHSHRWVQIAEMDFGEKENAIIWLDTALAETVEHEARLYPVARIRSVYQTGDRFVDIKYGVDCEQSKLAPFDGLARNLATGESERESSKTLHFLPLPEDYPVEIRDPVFKHVCGPEWSYTPSK